MPETTVQALASALNLTVFTGSDWLERSVITSEIHRPGLEMAGFFVHNPVTRVKVIGQTEFDFFGRLSEDVQMERARRLMHAETPCLILSRGLQPPPVIADCARDAQVPVLGANIPTTRLISRLGHWLDNTLAPRITLHGVFVELFGVGVLLTGTSGIGKSETALELIKQGHRLVADDAVEIRRPSEEILVGSSPDVVANLLEIRGLGIIDVCKVFGAGAVRPDKRVELNMHFEPWEPGAQYDRLGFDTHYRELLGVKIPLITVPVAPGRNLAMLVETAAVNFRARTMGMNVDEELRRRINAEINKG